MIPSFFKVSLRRFLWLMGAYSFTRLLFLLWNWHAFKDFSWLKIATAFFFGLRFDASAILFTNAILFLIWMLPTRWLVHRAVKTADLALFTLINFAFLALNFVDTEFVNFIGKRVTFQYLSLRQDIEEQSSSIILHYWYFGLGLVLLTIFLAWMYPAFPEKPPREKWLSGALWRLAAAALIFTGMRGGYQLKPLVPMNAYFDSHHELGLLALNSPFNFIKSHPLEKWKPHHYFSQQEAILRVKNLTQLSRPALGTLKGWNVVVLIIESFGSEYTGIANSYKGYTPFFDSLARDPHSIYFKYNFANGRSSVEGVPAVLCGLPNMMTDAILNTDMSNDQLGCLPKILSRYGYSSYFLHGAHNGSMHFDTFSPVAGFQHFIGYNEFPIHNDDTDDHYWGIIDEPMLQYATKVIDQAPKPVFLGLFTLSSHFPYFIPPKYRGKFRKGRLRIEESIGYTDYSLKKFFETARTRPWFDHTIFVITADHTSKSDHKQYYDTLVGPYRIPLLFYVPGVKPGTIKYSPDRITQQIDIKPSLLDLLGITVKNRLLVGESVFDLKNGGQAFDYPNPNYWYMNSHVVVDFGQSAYPTRVYMHTDTHHLVQGDPKDPKYQNAINNIKAIIQYFDDGLINNDLYKWRATLNGQAKAPMSQNHSG